MSREAIDPHLVWGRKHWAAALLVAGLTLAGIIGCDEAATPAPPTMTPLPPALQAGQRIFATYCTTCHRGGQGGAGPRLIDTDLTDIQIRNTVRQGDDRMPAFGQTEVPDSELQSLVDYIRSLK